MPHFVGKLWPGKSEQQKTRLTQEITDSVMSVLNYGAESVSVGFVGPALQETGIQPARKVRNSL